MRVTNLATHERLLRDMQRQASALDRAAQQVASGQRHPTLSADPVAAAATLRADTGLRALNGYARSVTTVRTRIDAEEAVLDQLGDLLSRAKELGMAQGGANASATSRAQTAIEVEGLLSQAISLGNLKVGGEYLFAGHATDAPAFDASGAYQGTTDGRPAEIGNGVIVETIHHGQQLFIDSGVLGSLTALRDALVNNDPDAIRAALAPIDQAIDQTETNRAEIGGRTRALDQAQVAIESFRTALTNERSAHADIPLEEALMQFTAIQTAMQAALMVTAQRMQISLTNYLAP